MMDLALTLGAMAGAVYFLWRIAYARKGGFSCASSCACPKAKLEKLRKMGQH